VRINRINLHKWLTSEYNRRVDKSLLKVITNGAFLFAVICSGFQSASLSWPSNGFEASGERTLFPLKTPVCARSIFSLTASVTIMENCFLERMLCRLFSTLVEMVQRCVSQHSVKLFLLSNSFCLLFILEMQSLSLFYRLSYGKTGED